MDHELMKQGEILLYDNGTDKQFVSVVFKDETFWLTQKAMAELFDVKVPAISKHLKNIFEEEELAEEVVVSKMEITTPHGAMEGKTQTKVSHEAAAKRAGEIYAEFRKKQDANYISDFDRETAKYLKGE